MSLRLRLTLLYSTLMGVILLVISAAVIYVISQVLLENSKPVEFGQPLFKVRPL